MTNDGIAWAVQVDELEGRVDLLGWEIKDLNTTIENLSQENGELEGEVADREAEAEAFELDAVRLEDTIQDALDNLRALGEVPLRDLEDSITVIVELLAEAL